MYHETFCHSMSLSLLKNRGKAKSYQISEDLCMMTADKLSLDRLSKNMLYLVSDYLIYTQIITLLMTCRTLYKKFKDELYYKKRAVDFFQAFYFQQFVPTEVFPHRFISFGAKDSTLASTSMVASISCPCLDDLDCQD